ncbi:lipase family protein [Rhodococcus sp. NPDC127528]|uniref:lipase family protein n=1 Tax=unclassified Rhodococcus (in: high G+C Gram-positive bacteria) TaxID=192944 RepID=UPI003629EA0E
MRRRRLTQVGGAVAAVVLSVTTGVGSAVAAPVDRSDVAVQPALPFPVPPSPPELDPAFYAPPPDAYRSLQPGEIIAARAVNVANFGAIPVNVDAWQLSYRSTNTRGEPVAAVTTVLEPRGQARGGGKLLSFQIAEDATAQYCAPSYAMQLASVPTVVTGSQIVSAEFLEVQTALAQGWAVSVPDYQGPNSAYAAGPLGGRLTLDGIRAAQRFAPLDLPGAQTRVGMWGYSGGATATGHAAELQPSYAPELNVVGVAAGGVPADLSVVLNNANNAAPSGLVLGAVIGLGREYPEFQQFLDQKMNPLGRALVTAKNPLCVAYQAALVPFVNNKGLLDVPGDPLDEPAVRSVIDRTRMGQTVPTAPLFLYQSNPDWIIPVGQVNTLVDTYCKDPSARVTYTRDHASEHLSLGAIGAPSALLWLKDRMDGVPAEPGCSTRDVGSMALDQSTWPTFTAAVGEVLAGLFGKAIGAQG